jgi:four helix bundle protein
MSFVFQNWQVYKDARSLRIEINQILKTFPMEEKYILVDQIKRAILSVVLQIAEGSNRRTERDKGLFVNRALTSLDEVLACFDCGLDDKYITQKQYEVIYSKIEIIAKQLRAFGNHLAKSYS